MAASSPSSGTSSVASPPLPRKPGLQPDFRGGRVGAKLDDLPASSPHPSPLPDKARLFEQGRFDRQNVMPEGVPLWIDALERDD